MNTSPRKQIESGLYAPVWREFNKLIDYVREISITGGRNVRVSRSLNGTTLSGIPESGATGTTLKHYRLRSIEADYLVCREWGGDGTTANDGTRDIYIARDPELRRTQFDNKSIAYSSDGDSFTATFAYSSNTKRTKTVSGTPEIQVIIPYYVIDSATTENKSTIILAAESENKTGIENPSGNDIYLVEITQRAWAKLET